MTDPETVADVLAEMRSHKVNHGKHTSPTLIGWADRIERAMAASAVPVAEVKFNACVWLAFPIPPEGTKLVAHAPPAVPVESLGRDAPTFDSVCATIRAYGEECIRLGRESDSPPASVPDGACPRCKGEKEGYLLDGDGPYLCNACYDTPPTTPEESP